MIEDWNDWDDGGLSPSLFCRVTAQPSKRCDYCGTELGLVSVRVNYIHNYCGQVCADNDRGNRQ